MAVKTLELIIKAREQVSKALGPAQKAINAFNREIGNTHQLAGQVKGALFGLLSAYAGFEGIKRATSAGLDYNSMMEDARGSLATLILQSYDYKDATGQAVPTTKAYTAALSQAAVAMRALEKANMDTKATFPELLEQFQLVQGIAGRMPGATSKNLVELTKRLSLLGSVSRVRQDQMGEEARSILQGQMELGQTQTASFFLGKGIDNKVLKSWREQGTLIQNLLKALDEVNVMAKETEGSWSTLASNAKDQALKALGEGFQPLFEYLKKTLPGIVEKLPGITEILQQASYWVIYLGGELASHARLIGEVAAAWAAWKIIQTIATYVHALNVALAATGLTAYLSALQELTKEFGLLAMATLGWKEALSLLTGAVGVFLAGWQLGKLIGEWKVAGKTINEHVQVLVGTLYQMWAELVGRLRLLAIDLETLWGTAWDRIGLKFTGMVIAILETAQKIPGLSKILGLTGLDDSILVGAKAHYQDLARAIQNAQGVAEDRKSAVRDAVNEEVAGLERIIAEIGRVDARRAISGAEDPGGDLRITPKPPLPPEKKAPPKPKARAASRDFIDAVFEDAEKGLRELQKVDAKAFETAREAYAREVEAAGAAAAERKQLERDWLDFRIETGHATLEERLGIIDSELKAWEAFYRDIGERDADRLEKENEYLAAALNLQRDRARTLSEIEERNQSLQAQTAGESIDIWREATEAITDGLMSIPDAARESGSRLLNFFRDLSRQIQRIFAQDLAKGIIDKLRKALGQGRTGGAGGLLQSLLGLAGFGRQAAGGLSAAQGAELSQAARGIVLEVQGGAVTPAPTTAASAGGGLLSRLGGLLGNLGIGAGIGSIVGSVSGGNGLGSMLGGGLGGALGGWGGAALGTALGGTLTGILGSAAPMMLGAIGGPIGMAVGAIAGSLLGSLFGGKKKKDPVRAAIRQWVEQEWRPAWRELETMGFGRGIFEGAKSSADIKALGWGKGRPQAYLADLKEAGEALKTTVSQALSEAFRASTFESGWQRFLKEIKQGIEEYVIQGLIDAVIKSSIVTKMLAPIYEEVPKLLDDIFQGKPVDLKAFGEKVMGEVEAIDWEKIKPVVEIGWEIARLITQPITGRGGASPLSGIPAGFIPQSSIPQGATGGLVTADGLMQVHEGERVLNREDTARLPKILANAGEALPQGQGRAGVDLPVLSRFLMEQVLGRAQPLETGGQILSEGLFRLHEGERVLNREDTARLPKILANAGEVLPQGQGRAGVDLPVLSRFLTDFKPEIRLPEGFLPRLEGILKRSPAPERASGIPAGPTLHARRGPVTTDGLILVPQKGGNRASRGERNPSPGGAGPQGITVYAPVTVQATVQGPYDAESIGYEVAWALERRLNRVSI